MGLLCFVKSAAPAPPEQWEQEAGKHGLDAAEKIAAATADPAEVATVQDALAASEAAESKFYTVQPGDTLGKMAAAEYGPGHGGEYHRIFEANKPLLSDPDQSIQAKFRGFLPFRTESLRMNRREDIFDSCALAGCACPARAFLPTLRGPSGHDRDSLIG